MTASNTKLRCMFRSSETQSLIIVVPGINTSPPQVWGNGSSKSWLRAFPHDILPNLSVFVFEHGLRADDKLAWIDLLNQGPELIEALIVLTSDTELRLCPILIVAHSLGGLIVKKGLCLALKQSIYLKSLINAIAGVFFLGTPHSTIDEIKQWSLAQILLRPRTNYLRRQTVQSADIRRLTSLCSEFEEVADDLPIFSVYETHESAIRTFPMTTSKILVISKNFACTNTAHETSAALNVAHYALCNVDCTTSTFQSMAVFVAEVVLSTQTRMLSLSHDYLPSPALSESAVASRDDANVIPALQQANEASSGNVPIGGTTISSSEAAVHLPDFSESRRDPRLPCHIIGPAENKDFFDRMDVLDKLEETLLPLSVDSKSGVATNKDLKTFSICGPGGIGKTQVATQFAFSHINDYDAIFWIHADQLEKCASDFNSIAIELGLILESSADAKDLYLTRELVKGWLAKPSRSYKRLNLLAQDEASWLLIFDNVVNRDTISDFWPPAGSTGSILMTSRDPLAKTQFYAVTSGIDLTPFTNRDAAELLLKITWREEEIEDVKNSIRIADRLGGFPLAITQMAGLITRQDMTFHEFLRRYDELEARPSLFETNLDLKTKRGGYIHTIASVWGIEGLVHSSALLNVLSLLDADAVPEELLSHDLQSMTLDDYPRTIAQYQDARGELLKSSLISKSRSNGIISIHQLIQDTVRAKMNAETRINTFHACIRLICGVWPFAGFGVRQRIFRWPQCARLVPHVMSLYEHYDRAPTGSQQLCRSIALANLLNDFGWYFQERDQPEEAQYYLKSSQVLLQWFLENEQERLTSVHAIAQARFLLAETHRNLGSSFVGIGNGSIALPHFSSYNAMVLELLGDKDPDTAQRIAISFLELATAFMLLKQWPQAITCSQRALDEAAKLSDPKKVKQTRSLPLVNLACSYQYVGRVDEALALLEIALKEREELYGINDRDSMITGRVLHGLGNAKAAQGLLDESLEYHEREWHHFEETVGEHHHRTATAYTKVAGHYIRLGKYDQANKLLAHALAAYRNREHLRAERGRAHYLQHELFERLRQDDLAVEALSKAQKLYEELYSGHDVSQHTLDGSSFDYYIHFWAI